jgi:hypothetical protein
MQDKNASEEENRQETYCPSWPVNRFNFVALQNTAVVITKE